MFLLSLILLITFSSTSTPHCSSEGTAHSLITYFFIVLLFHTHAGKFSQTQHLFCSCVRRRVQISYHIFLSTAYHSSSVLYHCLSFITYTHTHIQIYTLLLPTTHTHSHTLTYFITKICKFPMNTLLSPLSHSLFFLFYPPRITTSFCPICKLSCSIQSFSPLASATGHYTQTSQSRFFLTSAP